MTQPPPPRAGLYARVSSEMQRDNYSIEAQLQDARAYCAQAGYEPVREYIDVESGRTTNRDGFQNAIADAEAHVIDVLVIPSWDRFSRSLADTLHVLDQFDQWRVRVESAREPVDRRSDTGWVLQTMHSTFAEWYVRRLSIWTQKGKQGRAESGFTNGPLPYGYTCHYKKDGGDGVPVPNSATAPGVLLAFEKYATGMYSHVGIANLLNDSGYRPAPGGNRTLGWWSQVPVGDMLRNPFYTGVVVYRGRLLKGLHQPIIAQELFDRCQDMRRRRCTRLGITARAGTHIYVLSGLARCARCGGPMHGVSGDPRYPNDRFYRCYARSHGEHCTQHLVRADRSEEDIAEYVGGILVPDDVQGRILDAVSEHAGHKQDRQLTVERIERELSRLRDLYVMTDLTREEYESRRDRLQAQLPPAQEPRQRDLEYAAQVIAHFPAIWQGATDKERQQLLLTLLDAVYLDYEHGPIVAVKVKPGLAVLFQ